MDIVTGHVGSAHVTSWQDRDLNQGIFGPDTYILNVGSKLAATIISNNEIRIADGTLVMQGCQGVIQKGTYDTISIDNGTQGLKRNDLICAQYTKSAGVESMSLVVIKGTAAATPVDPSYTSGDIQNGDALVQVPVYRVVLNGLTVTSVDPLLEVVDSMGSGMPQTASGTVTLPNWDGNPTNRTIVHTVTLPAGLYLASVSLSVYQQLSSLMCDIGTNEKHGFKSTDVLSGAISEVGVTALFSLSASSAVYFHAYQSSGSSVSDVEYQVAYKKVG